MSLVTVKSMKNHAILTLMLLLICASDAAIRPTSRNFDDEINAVNHVLMKNDLGTGDILTVRCTDMHGMDLGPNKLAPLASYDLQFTLDRSGETRFNCSFAWSSSFHYFLAYEQSRDQPRCGQSCCWSITQAHGPCSCSGGGRCSRWN